MLINLNIDLLRAFVVVADTRSFTNAGEVLFRSQSTVSIQIKKLEQHTQTILLNRTNRDVTMTEDGRIFYGYATKILGLHDELRAELKRRPKEQITVRVGIPDDFAHTFLEGVFDVVREWSPNVDILVTSDVSTNLRALINQGHLDLAIVTSEEVQEAAKFLRREKLKWVCGESMSAATLSPLPLALFADGCIFRRRALEALESQGRPRILVHSSNSFAGILAMLRSGNAITVLAESSVEKDLVVLEDENQYPDLGEISIRMLQNPHCGWPKIDVLNRMIEALFEKTLD